MQDVIIGKYRLTKTENFDAFLSEIGTSHCAKVDTRDFPS